MVRAILDGRKTQTRRALRVQPPVDTFRMGTYHHPDGQHYFWAWKEAFSGCELHTGWEPICCPYGQPGDRLWVRETFCQKWCDQRGYLDEYLYRATEPDVVHPDGQDKSPWRPSIHMPRAASRITLEITGVRVERLQDISEADAWRESAPDYEEGVDPPPPDESCEWSYRASFQSLWQSINGAGSWTANPWVWVVEFKRL